MDFGAFILAMILSFGIKIPVMVFTTILLVRMYKVRKNEASNPDFNYLFFSLIFFAFSEIFCAFETYILKHAHFIGRILHAGTSSLSMAFFAVGVFLLLDRRLIHFSTVKCFGHDFCRSCTALSLATCKFSKLTVYSFFFLLFACFPPLFAPVDQMNADSRRYILPIESFNTWYDTVAVPFFRSMDSSYQPISAAMTLTTSPQVLVTKIMPLFAFLLIVIGIVMFLRKSLRAQMKGMMIIFFASGILAYTYNELILHRITGELLIGGMGHEIGEFLFLLCFGQILKIFYQAQTQKKN